MIESVIMIASLGVLGYAFYMSSRTLWVFKSEGSSWKYLYALVSGFIVFTFFLMGILTFSFLLSSVISKTMFSLLNVVVGIFFLSSAGLIGAVIRYHLSVMGAQAADNVKEDLKEKGLHKEAESLDEQIESVKGVPNKNSKLNKIAAINELKMIELRNKIKRLQKN